MATAMTADGNADWWRGCVIYQVYPRSFQDTTGDGSGDLAGITARLAHIASLGVDAVWLSPFFKSPMADMGYDVSDYLRRRSDVRHAGGFRRAGRRGAPARPEGHHRPGAVALLRQASNGSSKAAPSRDNPKADWYVWADPKPDGNAPNNWLSVFGGPAWEWDSTRRQYYMHNFLASQPDLNFHNPEVQDALLETVRFWLERGVDGFRLDTVNYYVHDRWLRSNPPLASSVAGTNAETNTYLYQEHLFDKTQPENLDFLRRFRALLDEYDGRASVGEVGDEGRSLQTLAAYTSGGDKLQHVLHLRPARPAILGRACARLRRGVRDSCCRRLGLLGVFQPRCRAPCQPLDAARRRSGCGGEILDRAARLPARLDLPLPGRGAWAGGGGTRLRGSARSRRHPLLAGRQGQGRLPHADGLGGGRRQCRLFHRQSPGCRCRQAIAPGRSISRTATTSPCSPATGRCWPCARRIRRWSSGSIRFLDAEGDVLAFIRRGRAARHCSASSISPTSRPTGRCRRISGLSRRSLGWRCRPAGGAGCRCRRWAALSGEPAKLIGRLYCTRTERPQVAPVTRTSAWPTLTPSAASTL